MKLWPTLIVELAVCWIGPVKGIGTNMLLTARTARTICSICTLNTGANKTEKKYVSFSLEN